MIKVVAIVIVNVYHLPSIFNAIVTIVLQATVLGILAPLIASWAPMMRALRPTIRDALDTTRSKA